MLWAVAVQLTPLVQHNHLARVLAVVVALLIPQEMQR
jgi:hypothetical protein